MKIITGKKITPLAIMVHGRPGVGKSTLGSEFPKPIFITSEPVNELDIARFEQVKNWDDLIKQLNYLLENDTDFKTVVLDSVDEFEKVAEKHILSQPNNRNCTMATAESGYGKSYVKLAEMFIVVRDLLERLKDEKNFNVILIAHSEITKFEDTTLNVVQNTYDVALHKKVKPVLSNWVSGIFYIAQEMMITKKSSGEECLISDGDIKIYTSARNGYVAKNRWDLPLEIDAIRGETFKTIKKHVSLFYSDVKKPVKKVAKKIETVKTETPKKETEKVDAFETMATYKDLMMESDELFQKMPENIKPKISIAIRAAGTNVDELERIIIKMRGIAK